ncbi:metallophosphoesterase family protein [Corynebacterium choanae]|uniref:Calcineurin-like phosphoesterase n=1 Tax=Corynebacterium choanae TaxID=1862358 RepID=A0A3G6J6T1_9CORY|nr:metallophosphoesterase [Corynebacterium choanae]AZA13815.1 Calcineurin-like phosphoesterase [Corynebacterium choanae]
MRHTLWAVSDLHAAVRDNRPKIDAITSANPADWLIVAGDVAERTELVVEVLAELRRRFACVIWVPGNHELFCRSTDRYQGREKYDELVAALRAIDVLTPEDPYPVFHGVTIVPLFTLYDYSFRMAGMSVDDAVEAAHRRQVVMTDQFAIAPFVDIRAWCWDRLAYSVKRLGKISGPTILVNHWPLVIEPVERMAYPELSLWCGTRHTRSWGKRYGAQAVVYGHLHTPGITQVDGVKHIEVSLGYPREWEHHAGQPWPYPVMEGPR